MNVSQLSEWPREDAVVYAVGEVLRSQGVAERDLTVRCGRQRGIDVNAKLPSGLCLICEAKGEPPRKRTFGPKEGQEKKAGQQNLDRRIGFQDGLALLIERMTDPKAVYSLAMPLTDEYCRLLASKLPSPIRRTLGLHVLLVERSGSVRHLLPASDYPTNWDQLVLLQVPQLTAEGAWR